MDIEQEVIDIISEELGMDLVDTTDHLRDNLGAEQIDLISIFMELEEHFRIDIPAEAEEKCATVQDCIDCVLSLI